MSPATAAVPIVRNRKERRRLAAQTRQPPRAGCACCRAPDPHDDRELGAAMTPETTPIVINT